MHFCYCNIISPWKRALKKKWMPFTQGCHVPSLVELAQWFWGGRFLSFANIFLPCYNYLPLWKGVALHLYKLESPSPKDALCQVWLKFIVLTKFTKPRPPWFLIAVPTFSSIWRQQHWNSPDKKVMKIMKMFTCE